MPTSFFRSKRAAAVAIAATVAGVSAAVLLSGQNTTARAAAAPGTTVRASVVDGTNAQAPEGGDSPELSADGTAVAFTAVTQLDNLETGESRNIYVRDLRRDRTVMISRGQFTRPEPPPPSSTPPTVDPPRLAGEPLLSLNGTQPPPVQLGEVTPSGNSYAPTISADGRYVAFLTWADNIVQDDPDNDTDILVCDRDPDGDGEFDENRENGDRDYAYFRVTQPQYQQGDGGAFRVDNPTSPKLSDDASRLVWEDTFPDATGRYHDVVRTAVLRQGGGAVGQPSTPEVVDTGIGENAPTGQWEPDVSSDGRYVVLVADYTVTGGGGEFPIYISFHAVLRKDMETGDLLRVDWDVNTTPEEITYLSTDESVAVYSPAISSDGGEIAFVAEEYEDTCSEGCWNSVSDQPMVFVVRVDAENNPVDSVIASRDNDNEIVNGFSPALSGDGRFVAFGTDNFNVHDGVDVAVEEGSSSCLNRSEGLRSKPMVDLAGLPPTSEARDERTVCQVVVRDLVVDRERLRNEDTRLPGTLVSAGTGADCVEDLPDGETCAGNEDSPAFGVPPTLSHNGSTVAFDSRSSNLVPGVVDDNDDDDVFVRTFRPELAADPTPLEFGEVELGDTFDRVVRFDHVGTGPLVVDEITVDGSDQFSLGAQTCRGEDVIMQQAGFCEVSVTFAPTTEADHTGTLLVTLRDGREFTVPLRGKGTEEDVPPENARFAAGPDPLNFGDRLVLSDGPAQTVTVTNVGGSPLTVTEVTVVSAVAPTDYTIAADTCSDVPLAPGRTCQVTVAFKPTATGDRPAVLRFVDNAPGGDAHLIGLAGKAGTPAVQLSPGVTQPGRVVTVSGTGFAPNRTVTITIAGSPETAKAVANAEGVFTQSLLIFPKSPVGNRVVAATIDGTALKGERPLLIVTPSVTPADFVVRG